MTDNPFRPQLVPPAAERSQSEAVATADRIEHRRGSLTSAPAAPSRKPRNADIFAGILSDAMLGPMPAEHRPALAEVQMASLSREELAVIAEIQSATIADQRREYGGVISSLHDQLRELNHIISQRDATISDARREARAANGKFVSFKDELNECVVTLANGRSESLLTIYDNDHYRGICPACSEVSCPGCFPRDVSMEEEVRLSKMFCAWERRLA